MTEKKDWKVTLSYSTPHEDTYLIQNETENEETTIKEVAWNSEKKDWVNK